MYVYIYIHAYVMLYMFITLSLFSRLDAERMRGIGLQGGPAPPAAPNNNVMLI